MLIEPTLARSCRVETFEEEDIATLQTSVQDWLDARGEETLIGVQFEVEAGTTPASYRAFVLYTE